jgi:hypothetical protein
MEGPCVLTLRTGTTERYLSDDNGRTVYFASGYAKAYEVAGKLGFNNGDKSRVAFADESLSLDALKFWHGSNVTPYTERLKLCVSPIVPDSPLPERST